MITPAVFTRSNGSCFQPLLDYHNRLIDAKELIEQIIAIRRTWETEEQRTQELALIPEVFSFYDAVAANFMTIYDQAFLRDLVHERLFELLS